MTPTKSILLVMFVLYLLVSFFLLYSLKNVDITAFARKIAPVLSTDRRHIPEKDSRVPQLEAIEEISGSLFADQQASTPLEPARADRRFDSGDELLAYLGSLDGTLSCTPTFRPYFTR